MGRELELGMDVYLKILRKSLQGKTSEPPDRQGIGTDTSKKENICLTDLVSYLALAAEDVPRTVSQISRIQLTFSTTCTVKAETMGLQIAAICYQPDVNIQTEGNIDYVPRLATIIKKVPMTAKETLFEIRLDDGSALNHKPGQFVEVSVFGIGEAPISLSSSPTKKETFELCVRKLGNVTSKLHKLNVGDKVGIRGPFGNGFDVEASKRKRPPLHCRWARNSASSISFQLCFRQQERLRASHPALRMQRT